MSERARIAAKTPEAKRENSVSKVQKKSFSQSMNPSVDHILFLQRTIGNQAVQRLIKSGALQAKLRIGQSGDRYEQETDRVADRVMRMPEPQVQRQPEEEEEPVQAKPLSDQITPLVQKQEEEEEESVQAKPLSDQITPLVQRQDEEEEEPVQAKPLADQITPLVQRQEEEDEEPVQAKPLSDQITPLVQRQEEEEEEVQAKPLSDWDAPLLQRQADEEEEEPVQAKPLSDQITPLVQRQDEEEEEAQAKELPGKTPTLSSDTETSIRNIKGGGQPLSESTRAFMEPQFGRDFSNVRIHKDSQADSLATSVNAKAFTLKQDIVFKSGQYSPETPSGKKLLAHELTHVVQQNGVDSSGMSRINSYTHSLFVQRYAAGEHTEFGHTTKPIKQIVEGMKVSYKVISTDSLATIAKKHGIKKKDLKATNQSKLRTLAEVKHPHDPKAPMVVASPKHPKGVRFWLTNNTRVEVLKKDDKKWRTIKVLSGKYAEKEGKIRKGFLAEFEGFKTGESILIPPVLNAVTTDALNGKPITFSVNGVKLDYGVGIAMGDFFESPQQMAKAPSAELKKLAALIKKEKGGTPVSTKEWEKATGGRYLKLAEKNEPHFAPPDPKLVVPSGKGKGDHKSEWEEHHKEALEKSQEGKKDEAFQHNTFGDHFLTDAFAAGHLINKRDVMEKFKANLVNKKMKFTKEAVGFFDGVARHSFKGAVKTEFSKYETTKYEGVIFRPNINSESRFSKLLQGIHKEDPDIASNSIAKAVHDVLNTLPKGLPVTNKYGDSWNLSGDGTLNAKSKEIGRKAVAQSQLNVLGVFKLKAALKLAALFKKVWDYVPSPSKTGMAIIKKKVESGTDPTKEPLIKSVAELIKKNYKLILEKLVKRNELKKS